MGKRVSCAERVGFFLSRTMFIWLISRSYWQDDEQTKQVTRVDEADGMIWMCTGDEGIMDEEGYVRSTFFCPIHTIRNYADDLRSCWEAQRYHHPRWRGIYCLICS